MDLHRTGPMWDPSVVNTEPDPEGGWLITAQQAGYTTTGDQVEALTRAGQAVEFSRNATDGQAMRRYAFDKQEFHLEMKKLEKEIDERGTNVQKAALEVDRKNKEQLKEQEVKRQAAALAAKDGPQPSQN